MKRPHALHALPWLVGILVLLYGCTGPSQPRAQTPTASAAAPSAPVTQLKPEGALPSSCPATPVYQGGSGYLSGIPWVQAQPTSSGIVGHLFYAQSATTKSGTYRFLHTGGGYPDGSATKISGLLTTPRHPVRSRSTGRICPILEKRSIRLSMARERSHRLWSSPAQVAGACRSSVAMPMEPLFCGS
jgi:hypothetical protein